MTAANTYLNRWRSLRGLPRYAALLLAATGAQAGLEFETARNYPNLGIMLSRLERAKADPLPMPLASAFVTVGEPLAREDRFDPVELWYSTQCRARWSDPAGNRLIIGKITRHLPEFSSETVSRQSFAAAMADRRWEVNQRERGQIDEWVATFSGLELFKAERVKLNKFALEECLRYPGPSSNTLVYAFNVRRVGNAEAQGWFCAVLTVNDGTDMGLARRQFESGFIATLALPPRTDRGSGAQAAELPVLERGEKGAAAPAHPVRLDVRRSIENYEDWWYADIDDYTIVSDVHSNVGKSIVRDIKEQLPLLRHAYESLIPLISRERDIALVRFFQTRDDYARYVGEAHAWSAGVWMQGRRELVIFQHENREEIMKVVRHEAFHQYLSLGTCMLGAPPWLNEGHACLFENALVDVKRKHVELPEDARRCALLLENLETASSLLPLLLQMDYDAFYEGTDQWRSFKYALAWGLAYYLQKGAPLKRGSPYASILEDYAASLELTRDWRQASLLLALAPIEMEKLQADFHDFWRSGRAKAAAFNPLP